jgi:trimethylamine--corrinoid protein Co-methyltransferase
MVSIRPIRAPEFKMQVLNREKLDQMHEATMHVLEEVGIRFPSQKALKIFAEAGAQVDFDESIVKLSPDLVMNALSKTPRSYTLASRGDPQLDMILDGRNIYIGGEGTGHTMIDLHTGERRPSKKGDVELMALLTDYLSNPCFYWPVVSASDTPKETASLHELEASLNFTQKHVQVITCVEEEVSKYAVEMALVVSGDREVMRERPPVSLFLCSVAPLAQDRGAIEAALVFAEAGLPVGFMAMPSLCSTSPPSIASNLVIGNAEVLSAIVLTQLAYPGTPVYYSICPELMNPVTGGVYVAALQKPLLYGGGVDLGHFYNIPVMTYYGGTDSKEVDTWITGKDKAIDAIFVAMTAPELIIAMGGLLEEYTVCHPEMIILDNDIVNSIRETLEGITVNQDTLMLDEIRSVGPGGHFLDRDLTVSNLRKLWNRGVLSRWSAQKNDFINAHDAALEEVKRIAQSHKPKPLVPEVKNELKNIIKNAEKKLCS